MYLRHSLERWRRAGRWALPRRPPGRCASSRWRRWRRNGQPRCFGRPARSPKGSRSAGPAVAVKCGSSPSSPAARRRCFPDGLQTRAVPQQPTRALQRCRSFCIACVASGAVPIVNTSLLRTGDRNLCLAVIAVAVSQFIQSLRPPQSGRRVSGFVPDRFLHPVVWRGRGCLRTAPDAPT